MESSPFEPTTITFNLKRSTNFLILSVAFKHSDIQLVRVLDLSTNTCLFQTSCAVESKSSFFPLFLFVKIKNNDYVSLTFF